MTKLNVCLNVQTILFKKKSAFLDSWGGCSRNMHVMAQVSAPSLSIPQVEERINLPLELCF